MKHKPTGGGGAGSTLGGPSVVSAAVEPLVVGVMTTNFGDESKGKV